MSTTTAQPLAQPQDWQPIATAPRDGQLIHLRSANHCPPQPFHWHSSGRWMTRIFGPLGSVQACWNLKAEQPTEWAPVTLRVGT